MERDSSNRDRLVMLGEIMREGRYERLGEVFHPDVVSDWPQTGERVVGLEALAAVLRGYPGGRMKQVAGETIAEDDVERYVMTPSFRIVRVSGAGNTLTYWSRAVYPDDSVWYVVSISTFEEGLIVRDVTFYAPVLDAPEWRSGLVERIPPDDLDSAGSR